MSKVNINQLDKVETLPFRCNRASYLASKGLDLWDIFDYKDSCVYEPWKLSDRIIKNNIGKSFDLTYSYFCKKIKHDQDKHIFLDKFRLSYNGMLSDYIIDENGNIQVGYKRKRYNRNIIFKSDDYKTDTIHKDTLNTYDNFRDIHAKVEKFHTRKLISGETIKVSYYDKGKYLYSIHKNGYKAIYPNDFIEIIISGWFKEFKSKNDPEYQRLINNRRRAKQKAYRYSISQFDQRANELLLKEAKQKEKEKQLNLIKIESHGFDINTSFRK